MSYAHAAMATQPDDTKERDNRKERDLAELRDRVKQQEKRDYSAEREIGKSTTRRADAVGKGGTATNKNIEPAIHPLPTTRAEHTQNARAPRSSVLKPDRNVGLRETETESDRRTHTLQLFCIKLARALIKKQHPPHEYFDELVPFMLTYYPFVAAGTTSFIELDRAINQHALQMKEKERERKERGGDKKERGRIKREQRETERKEKQRKDKEQKEREAHEQKEKEHVQLEKEQKEREEREQKEKEQKESAEREKESKEHARKEAEPRAVQQTPSQTPNATATLSKQKTVTSASETSAEVRTSNTDRSPAQQASRDREQLGKRAGPSVAATGATEKRSERHRKQSAKAQAAAAGSA